MNKFTVMLVPSDGKPGKTFQMGQGIIKAFPAIAAVFLITCGYFAYDYSQLLQKKYDNEVVFIENQHLKENITLLQVKLNSLSDQLERIHVFEKKIRSLTGLDKDLLTRPYMIPQEGDSENPSYEQLFKKEYEEKIEKGLEDKGVKYQEIKDDLQKKTSKRFNVNYDQVYSAIFPTLQNLKQLDETFANINYKELLIESEANRIESNLNDLDSFLLDKNSLMRSLPVLMPTPGWITSFYGVRISPYSGRKKMHEGIDIGAPYGAPITASADGTVVFSGVRPGFGKNVQIDHGYGLETIYAHSQKLFVKSGEKVKRGDLLASVGSTGHSTGPHLHYEVRVNGVTVDPYYFILEY